MAFKTKEQSQDYHKKRFNKKRAFLDELRNVPCTDCQQKFPVCCMEFDHVPERGPKLFSVSSHGGYSLNKGPLLDEIAKCDVVCANCHAIRTFSRGQYSRSKT